MTTKPFLWRTDLIEIGQHLRLTESRRLIENLARHLVLVHRRSAGLLRAVVKLG